MQSLWSQWLWRLRGGRRRKRAPTRHRCSAFAPRLESLEDRVLPSVSPHLLRDINFHSLTPSRLTAVGSTLFFSTYEGLWRSDGTSGNRLCWCGWRSDPIEQHPRHVVLRQRRRRMGSSYGGAMAPRAAHPWSPTLTPAPVVPTHGSSRTSTGHYSLMLQTALTELNYGEATALPREPGWSQTLIREAVAPIRTI